MKLPNSMLFRVTVAMVTVTVLAEVLAGVIWFNTTSATKRESAQHAVSAITSAAGDTFTYFTELPINYRHLVLNQLRDIGGTRFFISINNQALAIESLERYSLVPEMEASALQELDAKITTPHEIQVTLTNRDNLRLFNSGIRIDELPALWKDYSLVLGELDLPILVIQIAISDNEWFYLATVMPLSFNALDNPFIDSRQLLFLSLITALLMVACYLLLRNEVRPFRSLARSATLMGSQMQVEAIKEEGSTETRAAIHAFNKMNRRIKAYLLDRESLFNAISHDIKTPLACLKLRTEMLDDDMTRQRFEKLLNEVEMMLKGALQCMRDNDIHEEAEWIDINELLEQCAAVHNRHQPRVTLAPLPPIQFYGKPLAIKRCIFNLVDNGVKYGDHVSLEVSAQCDALYLSLRDSGPGIDDIMLEKVFEPYFRANTNASHGVEGSGLGLSIARSIARSHGGDIKLINDAGGGLRVEMVLMNMH
uniref:ATP-binding protein n=1 Tax=Thaumasiovibrio occultus TaxID=1891184 RepID=UPI000B364092|nr:ATP-binding protein [Thaumasiovibrio occultus]